MGGTAGAVITAVGGIFTVVVSTLLAWFIRKTDRDSKIVRASMEDQRYILKLVSTIRDDYWRVVDFAYDVRGRYRDARRKLAELDVQVDDVGDVPKPLHRDLEARHAAGEPVEDDE